VLATIGGFLGIPGLWEPFEEFVAEVAHPLVLPSTAQDYGTSLIAVALGVLGIFLAWRAVSHGRALVGSPAIRNALERKLWFDELYDAIFYAPAVALATRLRDGSEPLVERSLVEIGSGTEDAARGVAGLQTGLLRTYAVVITASVAVLVVVFVVVR
jgi:NADH:ubiquinone oxidoreductase subunit 5 (subunit L)/multisubunit Na+/H+ antiporter MnhA subunit